MTAKALTSDYYGQDISRSYFTGCSRGGGQALMEAQRYPEDFEGIFRTLAQALRRCVILRLRLKSLADWNETLKPGIAGAEERGNADLGSVAVATPVGSAPRGDATAAAARVADIVVEGDSGVGAFGVGGSACLRRSRSGGGLSKDEG